jgi:hypothetical protein
LSFLLFFFSTATIHRRLLWKKTYYAAGEVIIPAHKRFIELSTITFLLIMLLLPLRHWVIADDVLWTEEGHRLSWRMMLRSRTGNTKFYVVDKATQTRTKIRLNEYLSAKQQQSVQSKPDFIWQFAQKLKRSYRVEGKEIQVFVDSKVSINGRKFIPFIDPEVDLAAQEWSHWKHHDWILPSPLYMDPDTVPKK